MSQAPPPPGGQPPPQGPPPGGAPGMPPPPGGQPGVPGVPYGPPPGQGNNQAVLFIILALVVVAAGVGAFFVLSGDDDDDDGDGDNTAATNGLEEGSDGTDGTDTPGASTPGIEGPSTDGPDVSTPGVEGPSTGGPAGGGDLRAEYVDAMAASMDTGELPSMTAEHAECVAGVVVDVVGVERLQQEATPDEIRADPAWELDETNPTEAEAQAMVTGLRDCGFFQVLRDEVETGMSASPGVTQELVQCAINALDDDFLEGVFLDDFLEVPGGDADLATQNRLEQQCGHLIPS